MHLSVAATVLASISAVHAFADTSPFVMFSTSKFASAAASAEQLQTSSQVLASAGDLVSSCPTDRYLLVSQPNIHSADIRDASGACKAHHLCEAIKDSKIQGRYDVAEVVGQISTKPLADAIKEGCMQTGKVAKIDQVELKHLPSFDTAKEREDVVSDNDYELSRLVANLADSYTVILYSDPNEFEAYAPDFVESVHMDLKRQADDSERLYARLASNDTRPLFEKYVFFTPGVFMSLTTVIVLLLILGVGLKALASLEVSYGAFDKEMGPSAQKKQQ